MTEEEEPKKPKPRRPIVVVTPEPGVTYPGAHLRGIDWTFPDHLAEGLHTGQVVRLEMVGRVGELRETFRNIPRWQLELLEVTEVSDE